MSDKKHIDRLFQEKFKHFEVTPDDAIWENIHNALHEDERKRRFIPFWWKVAGVAAILLLLFTVGNTIFNSGADLSEPEIKVVETENPDSSSDANNSNGLKENNTNAIENRNDNANTIANTNPSEDTNVTSNNNKIQKTGTDKERATSKIASEVNRKNQGKSNMQTDVNALQNDKTTITTPTKESVAKNSSNLPQLNPDNQLLQKDLERLKTIQETEKERTKIAAITNSELKEQTQTDDTEAAIASTKEEESIEEAIAKANPTNEKEKEEQPNRWNITPNVAPVYFNSLGKGSTIHSQFVNNSKSGEVNMSYGISGSYAINDKIKVRAGINRVDLGYSTDGVIAFRDINSFNANSGSGELRNINFNSQGEADAYMSTSSINSESAPQFVVSNVKGSLEQQFGYIEVPLELEYSIVNNKFGLNVIGGFSTLFLNNNDVYSVSANERLLLGEANNINSTSYSANFGLGLNYNVSNKLKLNFEPMFKYQINTFTNTSGDFRPYFIGVYTGFSFKF